MKNKGFTLTELIILLSTIVSLFLGGFIMYALIHFIMKFW